MGSHRRGPDEVWQQLTEEHLPIPANPTDRREPYILAIDSKILFIIDKENNNIILREKAILIRALVLTPTPPKIAILCNMTGVSRLLRIGVAALTNTGLPLSCFYCIADRVSNYFDTRRELLVDGQLDPLGPWLYQNEYLINRDEFTDAYLNCRTGTTVPPVMYLIKEPRNSYSVDSALNYSPKYAHTQEALLNPSKVITVNNHDIRDEDTMREIYQSFVTSSIRWATFTSQRPHTPPPAAFDRSTRRAPWGTSPRLSRSS